MSARVRHPAASLTLCGQSFWDIPSGADSIATKIAAGLDVTTYHVYRDSIGWSQFLDSPVWSGEIMRTANAAPLSILVLMGGTTDIANAAAGSVVYDRQVAMANLWTTAGGTRVICSTTCPAYLLFGASAETERLALNAAIMANGDGAFDRVVDIAASPMHNSANATYYADTVHPTAAGATIIASLLAAAVTSLL